MTTSALGNQQGKKNMSGQPAEKDDAVSIPVKDKNDTPETEQASNTGTSAEPEKPVDPIVELEEKLAAAQEEAKTSYDRFLRISAEFDNYKKRILREISESRKYANETLFKELLSVVDNLERALSASKEGNGDTTGLIDGVELTLGELLKIFEKFTVKPVEAQGEPFDPTYHQAMGQEKTDQYPENTVTQEFQRGYTFHDRLLRPAMVMVAKPTPENDK